MRTLIEGGWVVAFNGTTHEVYEGRPSLSLRTTASSTRAGPTPARRTPASPPAASSSRRASSIPTCIPPAAGATTCSWYMAKNDYRTANYMAFAAPLKGAMKPPPPEAVAALRAYVFLHTLKQGTTTVIDVGGLRGDWDGYARLVDDLGVRVYASPPFRDRDTFMDTQGPALLRRGRRRREAAAAGGGRLRPQVRRHRGRPPQGTAQRRPGGDVHARGCCARARTPPASWARPSTPTRAGTSSSSSASWRSTGRRRCSSSPTSASSTSARSSGHAVFTTAHPWPSYPVRRRPARCSPQTGATVGPLPVQVRQDGDDAALPAALSRGRRDGGDRHRHLSDGHGVRAALGRPSSPRSTDAQLPGRAGRATCSTRRTLGGTPLPSGRAGSRASRRPATKADILLIDLDRLGGPIYADPIKALVDAGSGRDVDTVIVDGKVLVEGRPRSPRRGRGAGAREGARGHAPLLGAGAALALGRRRRGPHRSACLPDAARDDRRAKCLEGVAAAAGASGR